jgi:DNA-binding phage protein
MPLTRSVKEIVKSRAQRDPKFRAGLLSEAVDAFGGGEADVGKALVRDYVNATLGFEELGEAVAINPKTLMRMFGSRGNPRLSNLTAVLSEMSRREAIHLRVEADRLAS